jgi:hypothetical protein
VGLTQLLCIGSGKCSDGPARCTFSSGGFLCVFSTIWPSSGSSAPSTWPRPSAPAITLLSVLLSTPGFGCPNSPGSMSATSSRTLPANCSISLPPSPKATGPVRFPSRPRLVGRWLSSWISCGSAVCHRLQIRPCCRTAATVVFRCGKCSVCFSWLGSAPIWTLRLHPIHCATVSPATALGSPAFTTSKSSWGTSPSGPLKSTFTPALKICVLRLPSSGLGAPAPFFGLIQSGLCGLVAPGLRPAATAHTNGCHRSWLFILVQRFWGNVMARPTAGPSLPQNPAPAVSF